MKQIVTVLVIVLLSYSAAGQQILKTVPSKSEPAPQTQDLKFGLDGRIWNMLKEPDSVLQKMAIVRGIYDGLMFGHSPDINLYYTKTSLDHLVKALDQFYQDYRNEKVLIVWALRVVSMELRGESKDAVDSELRRVRKLASND
jgi:hypothetical protein